MWENKSCTLSRSLTNSVLVTNVSSLNAVIVTTTFFSAVFLLKLVAPVHLQQCICASFHMHVKYCLTHLYSTLTHLVSTFVISEALRHPL